MRSKHPRIELLRSVPGLSGAPDTELAHIAPLVDEVEIEEGHVLVAEGSLGHEAFIIAGGEATVTLNGRELARLGPGEFVGEMALLDHAPRSATVTARTPMHLLVIHPATFGALISRTMVGRRLAESLAERLRRSQGSPTVDTGPAA